MNITRAREIVAELRRELDEYQELPLAIRDDQNLTVHRARWAGAKAVLEALESE